MAQIYGIIRIGHRLMQKKKYGWSVGVWKQKKDLPLRHILHLSEPLVGFEPTTPRLQITCSGQLS